MHDQKWTLSCSWKVFSMEIILLRCLRLEFICIGHFSIFRPGFFSSSCSWCGVWQLVSAANINVLDISTVCEMLCNWQAHSSTLETVSFSPTQPTIEKLFIHKKNIGKVFHLYFGVRVPFHDDATYRCRHFLSFTRGKNWRKTKYFPTCWFTVHCYLVYAVSI